MNLETLSASPSGAGDVSTSGACSLTSLISLGCRSRAEAAQSFAKKLHTKLWSIGPLYRMSSLDGQFSSGQVEDEEEQDFNWPAAVETRLDLNKDRVETVVTSVPRVLASSASATFYAKKNNNIRRQPLAACNNIFPQQVPRPTVAAFLVMEQQGNDNMGDTCLSPMSDWISSYRKEVNGDEPASSISSGVSHDLESDTSSVTNQQSDSDQYFDFGTDTPQDVDSAGEETISQDPAAVIVINHDDGLPIQPESGCIFGSPVASEDEHDHDEEESSIYESLSQSPASVGYFLKLHHDRNFSNLNSSEPVCIGVDEQLAPQVQKTIVDSNSTAVVNTTALAQSQPPPFELPTRVKYSSPPPHQGDLEVEPTDGDCESAFGPLGENNSSHRVVDLAPFYNENENQSTTSSNSCSNDENVDPVSDLEQISTMVHLNKEFTEVDRATDGVRSLQLNLVKDDVTENEQDRSSSADVSIVLLSVEPTDVVQSKVSTCAVQDDVDEEADNNLVNRHRVQRSTSLKTGKTPPGTPGSKKIVRFADALGLDLALVRTFLDEVPNVPQSAFSDLSGVEESSQSSALLASSFPWRTSATYNRIANTNPLSLVAAFTQPGNLPNFLEMVKQQKICLETACLVDDTSLSGVVRVLNIDFHKSVLVRYTTDEWKTHSDQLATYVPGSCDGLSDRFTFSIPCAQSLQVGQRFIFALCYRVAGQEIWDSNLSKNYVFQCISNTNFMPSIALNSSLSPSDSFLPYM